MTSTRYTYWQQMDSKQSISQPQKTDRQLLSIGIKAGFTKRSILFFQRKQQ
jgi:hypothetical protein